jgi:hypothetical protein
MDLELEWTGPSYQEYQQKLQACTTATDTDKKKTAF